MSIWGIVAELNTHNIRFPEFRKLLRGPALVGYDCICLHQGTPEWRYWRRNQTLCVSTCLFFDAACVLTQVYLADATTKRMTEWDMTVFLANEPSVKFI